MTGVAAAAIGLPAQRAVRIAPMEALRLDRGEADIPPRKRHRGRPGGAPGHLPGAALFAGGLQSGVEYEYQVIAVNRAGEGPASNIVRAVL